MKLLVLFATIALSAAQLQLISEWNTFKRRYQKDYTPMEDVSRKVTYFYNKDRIDTFNRKYDQGESSFKLAMNQFGDWTEQEFFNLFGLDSSFDNGNDETTWIGSYDHTFRGRRETGSPSGKVMGSGGKDWRMDRAVNAVRDQTLMGKTQCNAGWAFAAIASLEAHDSKFPSGLQQFSEQNLLDCVSPNAGCRGALMPLNAFQYILERGNINPRKDYPYTGTSSNCKYNEDDFGTSGVEVVKVVPMDEQKLLEVVVEEGPVVVTFDPFSFSFMFYGSGVYDDYRCSESLANQMHYMTIIGFENDNELGDQWIVRNSFGTSWGESGYIRVPRDVNQCGIANSPVYMHV